MEYLGEVQVSLVLYRNKITAAAKACAIRIITANGKAASEEMFKAVATHIANLE